jgi:hypothetical protein
MSRPCHGFVTTCTRIKPLILLACHDVTTSGRGPGGKAFIGLQFVPRIHKKPRTQRTTIRTTTVLARELHRWGIQIVADLGSHIRSQPKPSEANRSNPRFSIFFRVLILQLALCILNSELLHLNILSFLSSLRLLRDLALRNSGRRCFDVSSFVHFVTFCSRFPSTVSDQYRVIALGFG